MAKILKEDFRNKSTEDCARRYQEIQCKEYEAAIRYFEKAINSGLYTEDEIERIEKVILSYFKEITLINNQLESP